MLPLASCEISLNVDYKKLLEEKLKLNSRRIYAIYSGLFGGIIILIVFVLWIADYNIDNINPEFLHAFEVVMIPALLLYTYFLFKDIRTDIVELKKEIAYNKCNKITFQARRFYHAMINKYLLFYPQRENMYIEVSPLDYNFIEDGETLQLITSIKSSEIICLQKENGKIIRAFDFSFRNSKTPRLTS